MRKLLFAVVMVMAMLAFGATLAYAGDCGKAKCASKCDTPCKPQCETKCAPKCDTPCESKCPSGWCSEKPKCAPVKSDCNKCGQTPCQQSCKPKCENKCNPCDPCGPKLHPYERLWQCASPRLCDGGCGENCIAAFPRCETCETVCEKVESKDCNGCTNVSYNYKTVCTSLERPRVIPWWFNETGAGNIYPDEV